ncbi:uncharacterized protein [Venturia canescens]|uniref:uncharacterized protein n=1 Tax=Venturia canescens TaxID=32260 RepID=UPI001C9D024A|nr:uncharacterized protein LOC122407464 [Venturia canescens]
MPAASSIYWDSVDSQRSSGGSSGDGSSRHYVDPWDLENYAYLRRHSIAAPPQHPNPPQQQRSRPQYSHQQKQQSRVAHRRRSHEQRLEPEVEYWYAPREPVREPGYHAPASVEELYFGGSRHRDVNQCSYYQPIYDDHLPHYAPPLPIYAPLSELEHGRMVEDQRLQGMLKRRNKLGRAKGHERNKVECFYHGSSTNSRRDSIDETVQPRSTKGPEDACYMEVIPPSNLGLNTYGHLKIDYTDSWNSLHRKIAK